MFIRTLLMIFVTASCATEYINAQEDFAEPVNAVQFISDSVNVVAQGAVPVELGSIDHLVESERSKAEGPVSDGDDGVYFTNPYGMKVFHWTPKEGLTVYTEAFRGPNGLDFTPDGALVACEAYNRRIAALYPDGKVTSLAYMYNGKKFNEPNDLFVDSWNGIYFSDPYFHVHHDPLEQKSHGVYYITPDRSRVILVEGELQDPNGIHASPDGKKLYVIESREQKTYVYNVHADGTLSDRKEFISWGLDGLTVDEKGNLYLTGPGNDIRVYNSDGKQIGLITVAISKGHTANACFGGTDNQTLFITAGNSLFSLDMNVKGMR